MDEALTAPLTLTGRPRIAGLAALGLAHSGDMPVWIALLAAAWFLGDDQWKVRAEVTAAGLVLAEIVVVAVKAIIRRARPPGTNGLIYRKADPYSFPSGHAARATLLCLLAWHLGPMSAFIAIVIWSPFMVVSRVAIGIHYVFDVAAGIALGGLLTAIVLQAARMAAAWL